MEVLISGSTGFIGSRLRRELERSFVVWTLDRGPTGDRREIRADLSHPEALPRLPSVDVLIHAAGIVGDCAGPETLYRQVNVKGTRRLLEAAVASGISRFILISTGGIYAPTSEILTEQSDVGAPGLYNQSKLEAEHVARQFESELSLVILRPFFPYGPGQNEPRLIPRMIRVVSEGRALTLSDPDGHPRITPVFIDDLVEQVCRLVESSESAVLNSGGPDEVSIRELANIIGRHLGAQPRFQVSENPVSEPINWRCDHRAIENLTGHSPKVGIDEGIGRVISDPRP